MNTNSWRKHAVGPLPDSIILKLAGDGAAIATSAMMVFLTFSFPAWISRKCAVSCRYKNTVHYTLL